MNTAPTGSEERRRQDKEMILNPQRWPMWPALPLKRSSVDYPGLENHLGLVTPDYPETIIHVNLFDVNLIKLAIHQLDNDGDINASGVKTTTYTDVDALLDDGWTVD